MVTFSSTFVNVIFILHFFTFSADVYHVCYHVQRLFDSWLVVTDLSNGYGSGRGAKYTCVCVLYMSGDERLFKCNVCKM